MEILNEDVPSGPAGNPHHITLVDELIELVMSARLVMTRAANLMHILAGLEPCGQDFHKIALLLGFFIG